MFAFSIYITYIWMWKFEVSQVQIQFTVFCPLRIAVGVHIDNIYGFVYWWSMNAMKITAKPRKNANWLLHAGF
jgi:hypothetical protein